MRKKQRTPEEIAAIKEEARKCNAERKKYRRAQLSVEEKRSKQTKEYNRTRNKIANMTAEQIEKSRQRNRNANLTAEQIERNRQRKRVANMTAEKIVAQRLRQAKVRKSRSKHSADIVEENVNSQDGGSTNVVPQADIIEENVNTQDGGSTDVVPQADIVEENVNTQDGGSIDVVPQADIVEENVKSQDDGLTDVVPQSDIVEENINTQGVVLQAEVVKENVKSQDVGSTDVVPQVDIVEENVTTHGVGKMFVLCPIDIVGQNVNTHAGGSIVVICPAIVPENVNTHDGGSMVICPTDIVEPTVNTPDGASIVEDNINTQDDGSTDIICQADTVEEKFNTYDCGSMDSVKMPKKVKVMPVIETRTVSKRAASKLAMQQMARISQSNAYDEPETLEILSDDDVIAVDPPTKKKYRVSHRKSSDGNERDVIVLKTIGWGEQTLNLEVWPEELSPVQLGIKARAESEFEEMNTKIQALLKSTNAEVLYEGDSFKAFEMEAASSAYTYPVVPTPKTPVTKGKANNTSQYSLVLDPRSGQVVGTVTPTSTPPPLISTPKTRKRTRGGNHSPAPPPTKISKVATPAPPPPSPSVRPTEGTAVGGLSTDGDGDAPATNNAASKAASAVVDLTSDDRPPADSREVSFNKLQGKTFPSLVVVARPHLRVIPAVALSERTKLDGVVKAVLMHAPTKFTEWLIQKGLIKSEQACAAHQTIKLKLGMYSDVSKFPFSGGYVWISECCPQRFVSVFSGSLFEGSPHTPSVLLKLIYHWCCQTNVQNVVQWVKVDNLYLKSFNTLLRAACTVALHTHDKKLGGSGIKVEIGVISLGTTSQDGNQRQVKVEVLGILEVATKKIRLRAVEPLADSERNYKKRFSKILEPLSTWVHLDSVIITDLTVDKNTLHAMGFNHVLQNSVETNTGNHLIMDYLRRIVPRMFQNTLSLLSRQIIQQFLDELVWREWFGTNAGEAFDNLIAHLAEQTKAEQQSMIIRLNKVAINPFKAWSINTNVAPTLPIQIKSVEAPSSKRQARQRKQVLAKASSPSPMQESKQQLKAMTPDVPDQMVPLEHYYYGTINAETEDMSVNMNVKCHVCKLTINNNVEVMKHYFQHVSSKPSAYQCVYCLAGADSKEELETHISATHPTETKSNGEYVCILCEARFQSTYALGKHMSREHIPSELPYQCGSCEFRCSSHKEAINHFHRAHNGHGILQCPFCIRSTVLAASNRAGSVAATLHYFLQHLQKHQKKTIAKKCPKCALWFINKDGIKDHLKMHETQRKKAGLIPWIVPRNGTMVPKSIKDFVEEDEDIDITKLVWDIPEDSDCKECGTKFSAAGHFPSLLACSNENCQYLTCCTFAMDKHSTECKSFKSNFPKQLLPFKMYCVCGFSNKDGNSMANHLSVCERHSAYPSKEAAKAAQVTHSMLDVLGLVRRPEELPASATSDDDLKTSKKAPAAIEENHQISVNALSEKLAEKLDDKHTEENCDKSVNSDDLSVDNEDRVVENDTEVVENHKDAEESEVNASVEGNNKVNSVDEEVVENHKNDMETDENSVEKDEDMTNDVDVHNKLTNNVDFNEKNDVDSEKVQSPKENHDESLEENTLKKTKSIELEDDNPTENHENATAEAMEEEN